jgi:hypothetical protein
MQILGLRLLDNDFPKILSLNYELHICLVFFREAMILKIVLAWQRHEEISPSFVDAIGSSEDRVSSHPSHQVFHNYYHNTMIILSYLLTRISENLPHPN